MNNLTNILAFSFTIVFAQASFAILDDNLGMTNKGTKRSTLSSKSKYKKHKRNIKTMALKSKKSKKVLSRTAKASTRSLGNVPRHIKENWNALSKDQKEIVYSYHNENPYAQINKEHFKNISKVEKDYEHDTVYGFDSSQQLSLDDLRNDINGTSKEELSEADKLVIDTLAALEE